MRLAALPFAPAVVLAGALAGLALPARAEWDVSLYGGWQTAPHSDLAIEGDADIPDLDVTAGWEGRSFEAPPQGGLRVTRWSDSGWGFGLEVNHAKVYADDETLAATGLDHLEFTDGLNIVTANAFRRFPAALPGALSRLTPYVGAGLGVSVPHVEVRQGDAETWGYQLTGPAVTAMAGASYALSDHWSAFGEYKATYSRNEADLDGGGTLTTNIVTNALNAGVTYRF